MKLLKNPPIGRCGESSLDGNREEACNRSRPVTGRVADAAPLCPGPSATLGPLPHCPTQFPFLIPFHLQHAAYLYSFVTPMLGLHNGFLFLWCGSGQGRKGRP